MEINTVLKMLAKRELPSFKYMKKRIGDYCGAYHDEYGISEKYLAFSYVLNALLYGVTCNDYFLYKFFFLNNTAKRRFVSESFQARYERNHSNSEVSEIINNKERTLAYFNQFVLRKWCGVHENNSANDFLSFFNHQKKGVFKPLSGVGGLGVEILDIHSKFQSAEQLQDYCQANEILVEEVIPQHEMLSQVYPNAINTVRLVTLQGHCIGAALRMGVGESNVDNAHSGGIFAELDLSTGAVIGSAMDYLNHRFITHPTTGILIPGITIPFWKECKSMVEKASSLVADIDLLGWDIAVCPRGPVLVEANTFPGLELIQAPNGHGLMYEFDKLKK